jgi:hypothetical protein
MRLLVVNALLALSLVPFAAAHRLDEYLQATLIGVARDGVDLEVRLTPGVAILPEWIAVVDLNRDGRISPQEQEAYASRVASDLELRLDGASAGLSLIASDFPALEAMREGLGTIVLRLHTTRTGRRLRFKNRHLPQFSAYLVNCLAAAADGLVVTRQARDEAQRSIEFDYSFNVTTPRAAWIRPGPAFAAAIGLLLAARLAHLLYTTKRRQRTPDSAPAA